MASGKLHEESEPGRYLASVEAPGVPCSVESSLMVFGKGQGDRLVEPSRGLFGIGNAGNSGEGGHGVERGPLISPRKFGEQGREPLWFCERLERNVVVVGASKGQ